MTSSWHCHAENKTHISKRTQTFAAGDPEKPDSPKTDVKTKPNKRAPNACPNVGRRAADGGAGSARRSQRGVYRTPNRRVARPTALPALPGLRSIDRSHTLHDMSAQRIASLLASATEILYGLGLGDRVVAVSHECDYPDEVRHKPRVTRTTISIDEPSGAIDARVVEVGRCTSPRRTGLEAFVGELRDEFGPLVADERPSA